MKTTCTRCHQDRWPFGGTVEPYTCQRCRDILAGKRHVKDPKGEPATPEAKAARDAGRQRAQDRHQGSHAATEPNPARQEDSAYGLA